MHGAITRRQHISALALGRHFLYEKDSRMTWTKAQMLLAHLLEGNCDVNARPLSLKARLESVCERLAGGLAQPRFP